MVIDMIVEVMSRAKATEFSFEEHKERIVVISISDPDKESPVFSENSNNGIFRRLRLHFADVEVGGENCITDEQAEKIAKFVFGIRDKTDKIVVHCEAGISRSAGVAAAIMKFLNDDDFPIFDNPKYCPNRTCYRKVLNALYDGAENLIVPLNEQERYACIVKSETSPYLIVDALYKITDPDILADIAQNIEKIPANRGLIEEYIKETTAVLGSKLMRRET
jgi:hypothetical protein